MVFSFSVCMFAKERCSKTHKAPAFASMTQPKQKRENATVYAKEHKQKENTTNIFFLSRKKKKQRRNSQSLRISA